MTDKAILVIDKPNACWECMLCGRGIKERFCIARIYEQGNSNDCDIKDLNKVESWCPLRPLPRKNRYNVRKYVTVDDENNLTLGDYLNKGWNECINEIVKGETE